MLLSYYLFLILSLFLFLSLSLSPSSCRFCCLLTSVQLNTEMTQASNRPARRVGPLARASRVDYAYCLMHLPDLSHTLSLTYTRTHTRSRTHTHTHTLPLSLSPASYESRASNINKSSFYNPPNQSWRRRRDKKNWRQSSFSSSSHFFGIGFFSPPPIFYEK